MANIDGAIEPPQCLLDIGTERMRNFKSVFVSNKFVMVTMTKFGLTDFKFQICCLYRTHKLFRFVLSSLVSSRHVAILICKCQTWNSTICIYSAICIARWTINATVLTTKLINISIAMVGSLAHRTYGRAVTNTQTYIELSSD